MAALDKIRDFWNEHARWNAHVAIYDTDEVRDPATREAAFTRAGVEDARLLARHVHGGMRVVDLGCGIGRVMLPLAARCREIIGVDISTEMLARARDYLRAVANATLVQTEGASLAGIADGSVDLVYSLLCLIHVDRRTAYRYMREMRRVLRPQGTVFLEFQNILAPEGLARFQAIIDGDTPDYPLEFYTPDELEHLLASVGLETLNIHAAGGHLHVTAVAGSSQQWASALRAGVHVDIETAEGVFAGGAAPLGGGGKAVARVRSTADETWPLAAFAALATADALWQVDAPITLPARGEVRVEAACVPGEDGLTLRVDGSEAPLQRRATEGRPGGAAEVRLGFVPPGFYPDGTTAELFPNLFESAATTIT